MKTDPPEHLPAFTSWEECLAYSKAKQDAFFIIAFQIEAWMGDVSCYTLEHYSEHKSGKRQLQTGVAWKSWCKIFGNVGPNGWPEILTNLSRFSKCDAPESEHVALMLNLVEIEDQHGEPVSLTAQMTSKPDIVCTPEVMIRKMSYYFQRMSVWMEAILHWQTHQSVALAPKLLQASREQRELYQLGLIQRNFGNLDPNGKAWWQFRHGDMAAKFAAKPELRLIGQAQANEKWGTLKRPQVDELTIHWWPLLQRHRWTDRDMRLLIRKVVDCPDEYPLDEDKAFADYRQKVLGLKKAKSTQDKSSSDNRPIGWKAALAMVNRLNE